MHVHLTAEEVRWLLMGSHFADDRADANAAIVTGREKLRAALTDYEDGHNLR